ncbi:hypothetical protein CBS101457_004402 [Exobasidium rhododendri]|nr:hypothetical protein CBS101457_004402 [Exobasidium rhododendri]
MVGASERVSGWVDMGDRIPGEATLVSSTKSSSPSISIKSSSAKVPVTQNYDHRPTSDLQARPPAPRTRSAGGLFSSPKMSDRHREFDNVDIPSSILSSDKHGLAGLSESLADFMKQQHHPTLEMDTRREGERELRQEGSNATDNEQQIIPNLDIVDLHQSRDSRHNTLGGRFSSASSSTSRPTSPTMRVDDDIRSGPSTAKSSGASHTRLTPHVASFALKSPSKASSSYTFAAATGPGKHAATSLHPSAAGMLRKASSDKHTSGTPPTPVSNGSPPESGKSTPHLSKNGKEKSQVLETHHLQLQTHGPSGRRMINQYIIETELGRGVHGKVRLARDTETGERVAVKIVEREGKKRLGGGTTWQGRAAQHREEGSTEKRRSQGTLSFEEPHASSPGKQRQVSGVGSSLSSIPTSPDPSAKVMQNGKVEVDSTKEAERLQEQEKVKARKRLLWTTDKKVKREIALLKKCAHENVVRLKEVIDDPSSKKIFMVLEFMEGGEVQWKDERGFPTLTVDEARRTLRDVVLGLEYLHYQGIIHRDIKPANLLWDAHRKVKISDFGVSHFSYALLVASGGLPSQDSDEERMKDPSLVDDHELAKTAGSPAFFAPELCLAGEPLPTSASQRSQSSQNASPKGDAPSIEFPWKGLTSITTSSEKEGGRAPLTSRKSRPSITKSIDIWALGVTLYCLLFGHVPFTADSEFALFAVIPREDYELPAFMGADRIRIGPRRKRWSSLPQWRDEEADVDRLDGENVEPDIDIHSLSEEARLVRDLLDRLLEKDPSKRIRLEEVKKHPWVVRDIADPPLWLSETDPAQLPYVQVSNEEVEGALTGFSKIKQTWKKFQSKLFGGFGLQSQHSIDRGDPKSRRMQVGGSGGGPRTAGESIQRQRSKSVSQVQVNPATTTSAFSSRDHSIGNDGKVHSAMDSSASTSKASPPLHSFSRGGQSKSHVKSGAPTVASLAAFTNLESSRIQSQSQPNSRPHSPIIHLGSGSKVISDEHLEKSRDPQQRRPSSFFKRAASKGEARERPTHFDVSHSSSHPTSKAGSMLTKLTKVENASSPRLSQDLDAGNWSYTTSSSQSSKPGLQRSSSNRTRSRSRLSDVFRNVLGHQPNPEQQQQRLQQSRVPPRNGATNQEGIPPFTRDLDQNSLMLPALAIAPLALSDEHAEGRDGRAADGTGQKSGMTAFRRVGKDAEDASDDDDCFDDELSRVQPPPKMLEVDDFDVDLNLSDDDLDDEDKSNNGRHASHGILRNDGSGWKMEHAYSSSTSSRSDVRVPLEDLHLNSLTPSVEGGYNLFKAPFTSVVRRGSVESTAGNTRKSAEGDEMESFAMTQAHSDEAEALRRASVAKQQQHHHDLEALYTKAGESRGGRYPIAGEGDISATSDERFADADEEEDEEDDASGEGDNVDEEDEGVSFQARKRAIL